MVFEEVTPNEKKMLEVFTGIPVIRQKFAGTLSNVLIIGMVTNVYFLMEDKN